jgi:hypothetical protein
LRSILENQGSPSLRETVLRLPLASTTQGEAAIPPTIIAEPCVDGSVLTNPIDAYRPTHQTRAVLEIISAAGFENYFREFAPELIGAR